MTHRARTFRNARGWSIVEALAAAAIVGVAATGTAGLVSYVGKQSQRARTLTRAMAIQTSILSAMTDKAQFATTVAGPRKQLLQQLQAGNAAPGFQLLATPDQPTTSPVLATVGQRMGYSLDGHPNNPNASDCDPGTSTCAIFVDFDIACNLTETQDCRGAYRVSITSQSAQDPAPAPLGAPVPSSNAVGAAAAANPLVFMPFRASDYITPLSYDFLTQAPAADCSRDPENYFITGVDRLTGQVSCIAKQATACPSPEVAHGVAVQVVDGKRRMVLQCHALANARCPTDYVMQELDYGQLDAGATTALLPSGSVAGLKGICVYRWKTGIPWQVTFQTSSTSSSTSLEKKVCNKTIYDAKPDQDCKVVWESNPGVACGSSGMAYATATTTYQMKAANVAQCTLDVKQTTCASGTTKGVAHAVWSGTCQVQELKTNPSLKYPPTSGVMGP